MVQRHHTRLVDEAVGRCLVGELVPGPAFSVGLGITALGLEGLNDPVKYRPVVEAFVGQENEGVHPLRGESGVEFDHDLAA